MDVFSSLSERAKILIIAGTLFIVTLSIGLIVFGGNIISDDNQMIRQLKNSIQADMLYIHPEQTESEGH